MGTGIYIADLEVHPAAQLFPEMAQTDLNRLSESIREHGVKKPIVIHRGQLVDGRNRVRAALICGIPWRELPKVNLPEEANPYDWAWMMNCERLDYRPSEKSEIHARIKEESGKLLARREEKAAEANRKRSEAAKVQHSVSKPRAGEKSGLPPSGGTPKTDPRKNSTAAELAAEAGVSQRTMERAMGRISNGGHRRTKIPRKVSSPSMWRVPRNITKLAGFLVQNMPSEEVKKLAALLMEAYQAVEATA
jgi:hypothetical protein